MYHKTDRTWVVQSVMSVLVAIDLTEIEERVSQCAEKMYRRQTVVRYEQSRAATCLRQRADVFNTRWSWSLVAVDKLKVTTVDQPVVPVI